MAARDDEAHDAERAMWVGLIAAGRSKCRRCRQILTSDQAWDITDRGLEHVGACPTKE